MRRWLARLAIAAASAVVIAIIALLYAIGCGCSGNAAITAVHFAALRDNPTALREFLQRMPKGGDLHVHLSGAVYAEDLIAWGREKNLCFDLPTSAMTDKCGADAPAIADAFNPENPNAQTLYDRMVNALSMRAFLPSAAVPTGHDQFFATFGKFGAVTWQVVGEMTADRLRNYAADAVQHTELMATLIDSNYVKQDVKAIGAEADFARRLEIVKSTNADAAVKAAMSQIDAWYATVASKLGCKTAKPDPGCAVSYRYIAQVNRNADEVSVFVQTALAAALVRADPRVAGLNFVGPEDYRVARENYADHMRMIGFLTKGAPAVPVALHAGELWIGLVPPADLAFHIRQAVEVAGARRIGHGVSLAFEPNMDALTAEMRQGNVAVEINLTSNDVILGVRGKNHPLPTYLHAGVPVVLSTDDAGVSRIDLTNEYLRAARDYRLGYRTLKAIARDGLTYAFLNDHDKREEFARFDRASAEFEHSVTESLPFWSRLRSLIAAAFGAGG